MDNVTLKLTMGSFSVEVTGPPDYAEKKLEELVGRYLTPTRPLTGEPEQTPALLGKDDKKLALGEFLRKFQSKNQLDRALAIAYYTEKVEGTPSFTTTDIGERGREAKYAFGNVSHVVSRLVSRGLMMSAGEKEGQRAYTLTASGEEYVASLFEAK